jgi:hypothetical protein
MVMQDDGKQAEAILHAETARRAALLGHDLGTLEILLHEDLVFTHTTGRVDSKDSWMTSRRANLLRYVRLEPSDVKVSASRDGGLLTCLMDMAMQRVSTGELIELNVRLTQGWLISNGLWKLAAYQATRVV